MLTLSTGRDLLDLSKSPNCLRFTLAEMELRKPALEGSSRWELCKKLLIKLDKERKEKGTDYATLENLKDTLPIVSSLSLDLRRVCSLP